MNNILSNLWKNKIKNNLINLHNLLILFLKLNPQNKILLKKGIPHKAKLEIIKQVEVKGI